VQSTCSRPSLRGRPTPALHRETRAALGSPAPGPCPWLAPCPCGRRGARADRGGAAHVDARSLPDSARSPSALRGPGPLWAPRERGVGGNATSVASRASREGARHATRPVRAWVLSALWRRGAWRRVCLSASILPKCGPPLKFSSTSLLQIICGGGVGMQFSSVEIYCFSALRAGAVGCWVNPLC
jgi:hypothetical protein